MPELTVCYAVTPDERYRRMATASIRSVLRHNPDAEIRMVQRAPGLMVAGRPYPQSIKPLAFWGISTPWALFLDADTVVNGPLEPLLRTDADFCARHATAWTAWIDRQKWAAICKRFGLPPVPVYNAGAFLCRKAVADGLSDEWSRLMGAIRAFGLPDPNRQPGKRPYWMLDQFALAILVTRLRSGRIEEWGPDVHSYGWQGEAPGLIHHPGAKRWKDPFE